MGEFFHGWRRKIGVAALVLASVFAAGWVRSASSNICDEVQIRENDGSHYSLRSFDGQIGWICIHVNPDWTTFVGRFEFYSCHSAYELMNRSLEQTLGIQWTLNWGGFRHGEARDFRVSNGSIANTRIWQVPYWSIVIPMTLLSAWLLLSKPRVNTPEKQPEQI